MRTAANSRIIATIVLMICATVYAQIPAFPGAEGYGAYANGGRGGDVYTVVNLNSSGPGSLRYGVENAPSSGRTIVFAVSGYIPISYNSDTGNNTLRLVQNKITIAGQTAPGDGIGLKDGRILVTGDDEVIRHIRVRHGKYGSAGDCVNVDSSANNTILDHMSLMFSTDENISFFESSVNNFTMQYSTSSWGMERHNAGGLWDLNHGTCHHSLWAHHRTRNPKARPYGLLEWINNVTFHWRTEGFILGDSTTVTDWYANIIGCYYIWIPDWEFTSPDSTPLSKARIADDGQPNFHLYLNDTWIDTNNDGHANGSDMGTSIVSGSPEYSATPFSGAPVSVTTDDPQTAYNKVISSAGALRLDANASSLRDELDTLLIDSVVNQESILVAKDTPVTSDPDEPPSNGEQHLADAYGISNNGFGTLNSASYPTDTDGDGMPDYWENALGWNATVQDHNTLMPNSGTGGYLTGLSFFPPFTPTGYTRLEEYLHFKAIPHASIAVNGSIDVDLRKYTRGFEWPVFSIANVVNGTAVMLPDGYTVRITPDTDFSGRCRFDFTVEDVDFYTWTQTFAVLVSNAFVPPDAPSDLNATAVSSYQIDLDWVDNSNNESGFKIERSPDGVNFSEIDIVAANTTTYSDGSLPPAATYFYRVRAFNNVANSSYTSVASDTTFEGPPSPPTGLSATSGDGEVTLSWSTSASATSYIVRRATTSGGPYTSIHTNATTGYVDNSVLNLTTYYYVVSAVNTFGESDDSDQVSATPAHELRINSGGPEVSPYQADAYYSGGSTYTNTGSIDTSGVVDPAPVSVYQTERHGNFTYIIPGLEPGRDYLVRLHFDDIYQSSSGLRTFNVYINGSQVLSNYDIVAETGARYKAVVHEFTVPADGSGQIQIEYETILDNALVSGIEVLNAPQGSVTIQVEDVTTTYGGGVTLDSNNAGFHVTAFANFPTTDGYVQFNNVDGGSGGLADLIVRFALGNTARTGNVVVNGSSSSVEFPSTGTWTTWTTMSIPITLDAGLVNTIRFESTGQDLANIDEITVVPTIINIPKPPPSLDYSYSNGTFNITWPTNNVGWFLQRSTNLLYSNDWVTIPGTETTNSRSIPVNILPWNESFYRLVEP